VQKCVFIFPLWVTKKEKYQNDILSSLIFWFSTFQHQQVLTRKNGSGTLFLSVRIFFPTKKKMFFPRHFLSPQNIYKRGFKIRCTSNTASPLTEKKVLFCLYKKNVGLNSAVCSENRLPKNISPIYLEDILCKP
jgi:hypothetical protein